ncbi:S8 family serine peptidase [Archangium gephyra]|uniref:Bacterial Ig-like domain protein n=1 Tax=Archangium gephyra TaxID=48 RepID=A0AAC8Q7I2_9BACT|nr:S8 family serine peptidase [Archangium gephyra]AKJ02001.1 Putative Bacterial Ig-like domain protein [Archangium gephyra]
MAWLTTALACGGSGNESGQRLEGYRSDAPLHKVQLSAQRAAELEKQGAKVLGDYGAFKLVQVDTATLDSLQAAPGVELRDDYDHILLNAGRIDTTTASATSLRGMRKTAFVGKRFHLVHFSGPVRAEWLAELEATGVKVVTYVPNNAYLVYGDGAALGSLQRHITASPAIQWDGEYLEDYKLEPSIQTIDTPTYAIQLIKDDEANAETLALIRGLQSREGVVQEAMDYVNVVAWVDRKALDQIVQRPDVLSIQPRPQRKKFDERQDMVLAGQITGTGPTGPGYLAWLASKGFTQAQFTASGFGVDVSDSGLDNGTGTPNHFGLYVNGDVTAASRVVYARLEGTASSGSTIQGCDGHGTLNAHIVAGFSNKTGAPFTDTNGFSHGLGVAPFVKVGSSVVFDPGTFTDPDYEDLQSRAYRDGMRISSNSWGAGSDLYDADAQRYDALVRDAQPTGSAVPNPGNQEMFIAFAAGNDGPTVGSIGTPATAKNVMSVGASENVRPFGAADGCDTPDSEANSLYDVASFSGRGPTADGRKKPDIQAPGTHVGGGVAQVAGQRATTPANPNGSALSCFTSLGDGVCGGTGGSLFFPSSQQWYSASSGTSHSTPAVAGAAALVRQYFINQGSTPPSPAMTKAFLMGSTRYMTGTGANDSLYSNNQGTGLMDLGMAFDGAPRLLDDQNPANLFTATGQTRTFSGVVADATRPFRVTLAWTDAPGSTTGSAWKNNLDLTVTAGGSTYKGNVFTGANSVTGGSADTQNNVENVFLPAGLTGPYTVTVTATNVNSDGVPNLGTAVDQDFALVVYNACTSATATPTDAAVSVSGDNRASVSWTPNGASSYNIYRATKAGGPYTRVGTAAAPPFTDAGLSGGTTYYYVVRAVECAESPNSNEASVTATGVCALPPGFAGLTFVNNTTASTCANTLSWSAATPICGGGISYSVYRSNTPGFTPSSANRIATGVTGTSFADDLNLTHNTPYYYVVRATETSSATIEETNTVQQAATPTGAISPGIRYFDDFDANRPASASAYWIPTVISGNASTMKIFSGCHYQSATNAYRMASTGTSCGGTYSNSQQHVLVLGGNGSVSADINGFSIPPSTVNPQMTFNLWYNLETRYDGVYLVYNTTGASGTWIPVSDAPSSTQPYISAGGYDNTLNSNSAIRIWTYQSLNANGALKPVTVNLGALAGQKVWFGFRFHSDSTGTFEGFYVDDVRVTADAAATCTTNIPPPGPAVAYKVTGLPSSVAAGIASSITVSAVDSAGVVANSYEGSAALASSDTKAVLPSSAAFTEGVASGLPVTFGSMGPQVITATDLASPGITGSGGTTVTPGAASRLVFTVQPSNAVAGASIPAMKVGLLDVYGNTVSTGTPAITLAIRDNVGGGTLAGTATVTAVSGVATFSGLSINKVGAGYTLTASSPELTGVTSSGFNITPAAANKLAFLTQPSTAQAGSSLAPAVQVAITDTYGNVTTSTANVVLALSASPAGATLSGTTTVAAVSGVATFSNLSLNKVGTGNKLTATSGSYTSAGSELFEVTPGAPYRALITRQPSDVAVGAPITPAVEVSLYDRLGNLATQVNSPVSVSLAYNTSGGALGGTTTVDAVKGVATFDALRVTRPGVNYTLQAGGSGLFLDSSVSFNVRAGAPARLAFRAPPANAVAGAALAPVTVEVQDLEGNLNTSATAEVTLSLGGPAGGSLGGTTTVAAVNGVATFPSLFIHRAALGYTLGANATGLTGATSRAFDIAPGAVAALAFSAQPANVAAGTAFAPVVKVSIQDEYGNVVASAHDEVSLSLASNSEGATLVGTMKAAAVNGVASFNELSVNRVGAGYTLVAASGSLKGATSTVFDVEAGKSSRLVFRTAPAHTPAGALLAPIEVEIRDAFGNPVAATNSITLTLQGGTGGTLGGTTTVTASGGVAAFGDLAITQAAAGYRLLAKADGLVDVTSGPFDVSPGAAAALAFSVQPGSSQAGAAMGPAIRVSIRDAFGNLVTGASDAITLSLGSNPGSAALAGTTTVAAVNGMATFEGLSLNRPGRGYTLQASAAALSSATSSAFEVITGAPARLVFRGTQARVAAGVTLAPIEVELQDALGNVLSSSIAQVTLSLGANPAAGLLLGAAPVSAVNGVAKFDGVSLRKAGTGYTLVASAQGFAGATSTALEVTPGPVASYALSLPASVTAGQEVTLSATAYDAYGNVATSYAGAVRVASSDGSGHLPANAAFVDGVLSGLKVTFMSSGLRTLSLTDAEQASLSGVAQTNVTPFAQPTVAVTEPAGGTEVSGEVRITAAGAVAAGTTPARLSLLVDGQVIATGTEATLTATWDSSKVAGGTAHTVTAVFSDSAGNVVGSAPVGITVKAERCGCGATSGADASLYLGLFALARYVSLRRRQTRKAA